MTRIAEHHIHHAGPPRQDMSIQAIRRRVLAGQHTLLDVFELLAQAERGMTFSEWRALRDEVQGEGF